MKRRVAAVVVEGGSKLYHRFSCCNKTVSEREGKGQRKYPVLLFLVMVLPRFITKQVACIRAQYGRT